MDDRKIHTAHFYPGDRDGEFIEEFCLTLKNFNAEFDSAYSTLDGHTYVFFRDGK